MNEWLYKWNCVCCVVWKVLRTPTRYTLGSMVSHFQKLFDVTSLSGVYPRMNEVYTRLGEMTNTMRNLRDVLELGNPRLESKLHCVLYLSSRSDRTQELKMLSWCLCSCVRQQGSSCWGREQGGQTGFLHWAHCWIPSAAGRGWHWQVRTQHNTDILFELLLYRDTETQKCPFTLCSIIVKVKQHDEFFPAFHALTTDILHTLGIWHNKHTMTAGPSLNFD